MILIAHRGNTDGPDPLKENTPDSIDRAIANGFCAEVDLWVVEGGLFLGHDTPRQKIEITFLTQGRKSLYIHAKNSEAVEWLYLEGCFNFFIHDQDPFTLTNHGEIWCYPTKTPIKWGINLMPEWNHLTRSDLAACYGVCSDYISQYT